MEMSTEKFLKDLDAGSVVMRLDKFVLFRENKIVNNVYRRNFNVSTSIETLSGIEKLIDNRQAFSDINIIQNCQDIISLTPEITGGEIYVPHGWNQDRLSFIMTVTVEESASKNNHYFLTGYTDYYDNGLTKGISSVRSLDPNMTFEINSITLVEELYTNLNGGVPVYKFKEEMTIVKNNGKTEYDTQFNDDYLVRPVDIFSTMWDNNMGTTVTATATEVNKKNVNPISYIGTMLENMNNTVNLAKADSPHEPDAVVARKSIFTMSNAAERDEGKSINCPFIMALFKDSAVVKPSSFRLPALLNIFGEGNVDAVTDVLINIDTPSSIRNRENYLADNDLPSILNSNDLANNIAPNIENIIAMEFYYIISTLLYKKKITKAIITLSNHSAFFREPIAMINKAESLFHEYFTSITALTYIDTYMQTLVLPKLTKNYRLNVDIKAEIDILGKSSIAITVEAGETHIYRYNSAMDNNFTPLVTNQKGLENIAGQMAAIMDSVYVNDE